MRPVKLAALLTLGILLVGCGCQPNPREVPLEVPRGYVERLWFNHEGRRYGFGPFVGYYFRADDPGDLTRLAFLCFNEDGFYSSDAPRNALLFAGEALLAELPPAEVRPGGEPGERIRPVFEPDLPPAWRATRPQPAAAFLHFHSGYDVNGPVRVGYWMRHEGRAAFTYDMGGRVEPTSPLYHRVEPGPDLGFAASVEFDRGPRRAAVPASR